MTRAFKRPTARAGKPKRRHSKPSSGGNWFASGFASGVASAAVAYLVATTGITVEELLERWGLDAGSEASTPARTEASAPAPAKPKFEFYTMLPEMEVTLPEQVPAEGANVATPGVSAETPPPAIATPGTYILQVGSFRRLEEAERLKANLAFIGLEADIQSVVINQDDTWHRVRVGPYRDLNVLSEARARLRDNGRDSIVLKIRN